MRQQIIQALQLSLVPDSNSTKLATQSLTKLAQIPGYCYTLMQIIDDSNEQIFIRQGALIQFKNSVKKYWECSSVQHQISNEQKSQILNILLPAFINAAPSQILVKLYRQAVTVIIGFEYKNWLPLNNILENINNNQNITQTLQFIIAICTNFQFSLNQQQQNFCYQFILALMPQLYSLVQRNPNSQIIYLVIKIIWKTVHYEVSDEVRKSISNGMDLIINVAGAINPQFENNLDQLQNRGSQEFYYFHAKKWATRIIYRFIYKHANATPSYVMTQQLKQSNKQFSKAWYDAYGQKVVDSLINQFSVPTVKKIRYFQLKCIQGLVKSHPHVMKAYAQSFQYNILPAFIKLTPEDQQIANNDPIEFINKQQDPTINYTNLKTAATDVWTAYVGLGNKKKSKGKSSQSGQLFYQNMTFLKSKLEGNDMLEKQMAMYLICQLRWSINNNKQFRKILPDLISQYVVPEFTNQIMFLRARAVQIFGHFGDLTFSIQILKKAVEGIYFCLTGDTSQIVRIKAASAFHVLLFHKEARELVKPLFQQILKVYLQLIEKYDLQVLMHSLSSIVEHFSQQIGPYSWELVKYLCRHFIKLYHKDNQQSQQTDYDGETELAAAGILNTIKTILQSPLESDVVQKMQEDILPVCQFIFGADDTDYIEDVIFLLRAYTHRVNNISQNLLFFYVISIYYVSGIPQQFWKNIPNLPLSDERKKALNNVKSGCNIQAFESVMPLLRNFISKDSGLLLKINDMFGNNLLEMLFKVTNQIYQKGPNQFDGQVQMNNCTVLMIYLIQNNLNKWNEGIINHIWEVAKHNLLKAKSKILKSLTAQLVCVLIWNCPQHLVVKAQQQNLIPQIISFIIGCDNKIKEQHQRQRLIFGLCSLLKLEQKPNQLYQNSDKLFNFTVKLVKKNCEVRVDQDNSEHFQTQSDQEQDIEQILYGQDQPEDVWQQDFENNYSSKLDQQDQIVYFKKSMEEIQGKNNNYYSQLMQTIPQADYNGLLIAIQKAIKFVQQ